MAKKKFWYKKMTCPLCESEFESVRVFSNAISVKKRDIFLRPTYQDVDPDRYSLVTCPECYFTAFESDFDKILDTMPFVRLDMLRNSLARAKQNLTLNLGEDRTIEDSHNIQILGILTYIQADMPFKTAQLFLKMGWYYMDKNDLENAAISYSKALKQFERAYAEDKKGEHSDGIMFYMSSLNIQLNQFKEGFKWLERLIKEYRGSNSHYIKAAQELWEEVRGSD
jgi:uncharacterized protein (DUF2225 family)